MAMPHYPYWLAVHPDDVRRISPTAVERVANARYVMLQSESGKPCLPIFSSKDSLLNFTGNTDGMGAQAMIPVRDRAEFLEILNDMRGKIATVAFDPVRGRNVVAKTMSFEDFYLIVEQSEL